MKKQIREALDTLKEHFNIESVYVFGSYARGTASQDSDLDLLVVFSELNGDPFRVASELQRYLHRSLDVALDVVVTTQHQFNLRQNKAWTIEHVAKAEGILV